MYGTLCVRWFCDVYIFTLYVGLFFFFKQKTAYELRISDWSSDVCSSDLNGRHDTANAGASRPVPQDIGRDLENITLDMGDRGQILSGQAAEHILHQIVRILAGFQPTPEESQQRGAVSRGDVFESRMPCGNWHACFLPSTR